VDLPIIGQDADLSFCKVPDIYTSFKFPIIMLTLYENITADVNALPFK
jgi:hypothetical protein